MRLLIGGSPSKIFHLKDFQDALVKLGVECKLVIDTDICNGFPSRKISDWFQTQKKFDELISDFKPDVVFVDRQRHFAKIASKNKPYFLATGASSMKDVERAVEAGLSINKDLLLMQRNTNYTAEEENFNYINLKVLNSYKKKFPNLLLGLSDHTHGHATVLGAVSLGACAIEKHFTDDNSRNGPDHKFSMNSETWLEMVKKTRELELSLGIEEKKIEKNEIETAVLQRRAIRAKKNLNIAETITEDNVISLRPCPKEGIQPFDKEKVLNKKLKVKITQGDIIKWEDLV